MTSCYRILLPQVAFGYGADCSNSKKTKTRPKADSTANSTCKRESNVKRGQRRGGGMASKGDIIKIKWLDTNYEQSITQRGAMRSGDTLRRRHLRVCPVSLCEHTHMQEFH